MTEVFRIGQFFGILSGSLLAQARTVQLAQVYISISPSLYTYFNLILLNSTEFVNLT